MAYSLQTQNVSRFNVQFSRSSEPKKTVSVFWGTVRLSYHTSSPASTPQHCYFGFFLEKVSPSVSCGDSSIRYHRLELLSTPFAQLLLRHSQNPLPSLICLSAALRNRSRQLKPVH